jgi:putative YhdH/YhfP family quinone oxidoreductase
MSSSTDQHSTFPAFVATADDTGESVDRSVAALGLDDLPEDGALIEVHWSSVNYKDGLATIPKGRVARINPLVPGVDMAGVVVEVDPGDEDERFPPGTEVIGHGHDIGVARHGGYARYARVPARWLVAKPAGLSLRDTMVLGTAGFTAALSVVQLEEHGVGPDDGPVLVTGATGGVGSTAVSMLAGRGYEVIASTGKAEATDYLKGLGAGSIIDRSELSEPGRPLQPTSWAAAVDCVGGVTLANVLARTEYGGAVAASGLTGGGDLPTTVMPFILRGVALLGVDSVQTPIERRRLVWERLGSDLRPTGLESIGHDIGLNELESVLDGILRGSITGRNVLDLRNQA